jgi:valyl-tRNA synthetase
MKVGRRLAIKILNASRFALGRLDDNPVPPLSEVSEPIDVDLIGQLADLVADATKAFDEFDYARALERTEAFFWRFCDDYVELVKTRAYGDPSDPRTASAQAALSNTLSVLLRLFAPFLPFVTEEVWRWWQAGSVHTAAWPTVSELDLAATRSPGVFDAATTVLTAIRREKTAAKRSMRTPVTVAAVTDTADMIGLMALAADDLKDAGGAEELTFTEGAAAIAVTLAPAEG